MRLKQWSLSIILFCVSLFFLVYSKNFFSSPQAPPTNSISLPAAKSSEVDVVLLANEDYYPFLRQRIRMARKSIYGTVYLFKTAPFRDNEPAELLRELIAASKRNVDVELILERAPENQNKEYAEANAHAAEMLRKGGVRVHTDSVNVTTHSKTFVIDGRYCFVGSHNFTHAAMAQNEELSVFIDSPVLAGKISEFIRQIPLSSTK
jgi:phosphatidylserine/phosphatidylglycerophosphate/cardiolipin synthase-like enzyme